MITTRYAPGALVLARGREWVVLPESTEDLLVLRPLGGGEKEIAGVYVGPGRSGAPLEHVEPARFKPPSPERDLGTHLAGRLLRDAVRLSFRSAAGPFRSLARLGVEPRPYQLVPLLMALRLQPVRMLIADDVGIGKTIEACLIARELLDRGEIRRLSVLCPPHLAEQWAVALRDQFHLRAELVLGSTAAKLERTLSLGQDLFVEYPITVVSTDYIKQERRKNEFLRSAPELIIVDEAHTCTRGARGGQRRHELLAELSRDPGRHMLLVTATPHSGDREAFRSLLGLLDPRFEQLPDDLTGDRNRKVRESIALRFIQRQRGDIKKYLDAETTFPTRETADVKYDLPRDHLAFFEEIRTFCRELVTDPTLDVRRARLRFWSVVSLLRALSSSPRAAAVTLRKRSALAGVASPEEATTEGRRLLLDLDDEATEGLDLAPGVQPALPEPPAPDPDTELRARFAAFAVRAEAIAETGDAKLIAVTKVLKKLLAEGRHPIVFCRFVETARYVGEHLRSAFKRTEVVVVDGTLPHEEREERIATLSSHASRVLVATDCISEGVNLQHLFDTVVHYDLAWNPTRHEQREGRVDRFGQAAPVVRALTIFGDNNPVDDLVLRVILRKHEAIRKHLGIAVPVPAGTFALERALLQSEVLGAPPSPVQLDLFGMAGLDVDPEIEYREAEEREKATRSLFAHESLAKAAGDDMFRELTEIRRVLGSDADVERFVLTAFAALGGVASKTAPHTLDLRGVPRPVLEAVGGRDRLQVVFRGTPPEGAILLTRTHPFVDGLARYTLETALDPLRTAGAGEAAIARRASVIRTSRVTTRTTLLLLRLRCHLEGKGGNGEPQALLAEDLMLAGFSGAPERAVWLPDDACDALLDATPTSNIDPDSRRIQLERILAGLPAVETVLRERAEARGQALFDAHTRVRAVSKVGLAGLGVRVHQPPDLLGVYIYLPDAGGT